MTMCFRGTPQSNSPNLSLSLRPHTHKWWNNNTLGEQALPKVLNKHKMQKYIFLEWGKFKAKQDHTSFTSTDGYSAKPLCKLDALNKSTTLTCPSFPPPSFSPFLFCFSHCCFLFSLLSPQRSTPLLLSDQESGNWVGMLCGRAICGLRYSSSQFWSLFWGGDLDFPSTGSGIWALGKFHNVHMLHRCVPGFRNRAPSASALDPDWQLLQVTGNLSQTYTLLPTLCAVGAVSPAAPTLGLEKAVGP